MRAAVAEQNGREFEIAVKAADFEALMAEEQRRIYLLPDFLSLPFIVSQSLFMKGCYSRDEHTSLFLPYAVRRLSPFPEILFIQPFSVRTRESSVLSG